MVAKPQMRVRMKLESKTPVIGISILTTAYAAKPIMAGLSNALIGVGASA
jgi:hypothetical protein